MPKKKTALTIEERLQQALVPAEEQPYEVPENWVWVRLGNFIDLLRGVSYKKHDVHNEKMENDCLILRGGNIIEGGLDLNADNVYVDKSLVSEAQLIRKNDIIIVSSTGSVKVIGRAGLAFYDYNDVAFGAFLTLARPKNGCNKSFVDLFFQSFLYRQSIRELASGVNINNIRSEYITNMTFPLPPLSEQQRIVERIEELFAKLDEAKERLQEAADSFAVRKAAILHKAFTGELTKQWRWENGVSDESWEEKKLSEITENQDYKRIPLSKSQRDNMNRIYDYYGASGIIDKVDDYIFEGKKLLIGEDGANLVTRSKNIAFIADGKYWVNNHAHILDVKDTVLLMYLCNYINNMDLIPYVTGSAQPKLTQAKMNNIKIFLPTLPEQHEIVRLIDDLLARERSAQQAAEQALASIDLMKKSILARAFRGELGTNKASEASALEHLKQVLVEG